MPYGLLSDIHAHAWSAFSTRLPSGHNSRLQIIVDELLRTAAETQAAGGEVLVLAGDVFHTRGSIDPEVFNPVSDAVDEILRSGMTIVALAGNHDLKSNESTELGNAFQSFGKRERFHVVTHPKPRVFPGVKLMMVPWIPKLDDLKECLEAQAEALGDDRADFDLILHAGIDGVLSGMPAHGLTPEYLAGLGFKRVFAGHYHHHCSFEDGKVWSIGATTHQTASCIGTKAGFLIVGDDVNYRASRAPEFVEVTDETDPDDIPDIVDGNYVRVRGLKLSLTEEASLRKELTKLGARGVVMNVERQTAATRPGATTAAKAKSLEASVADFIQRQGSPHAAVIQARAASIIATVRAATE